MDKELFWIFAALVAFGAILSWIGRTWVAQLIAWLVVGFVGGTATYLGVEIYRASSAMNRLADELDSPLLRFALELGDLAPVAAALEHLSLEQRQVVILVIVMSVLVAITLPFISFSNGIWAAMTSGKTTDAVREARRKTSDDLDRIGEKGDSVSSLLYDIQRDLRDHRQAIAAVGTKVSKG